MSGCQGSQIPLTEACLEKTVPQGTELSVPHSFLTEMLSLPSSPNPNTVSLRHYSLLQATLVFPSLGAWSLRCSKGIRMDSD